MAGLEDPKAQLSPSGRKTKRKVSKKLTRKNRVGYFGNERTDFKPKFWKRY